MSTAAVKIDSTIAQPFVVAGDPFSLTTTFQNSHEGPIEILQITYHIPHQVQWIHHGRYGDAWDARRARHWLYRWVSPAAWRDGLSPPGQPMFYSPPKSDLRWHIQASESGSYSFGAVVPGWLFASGGKLVFPAMIEYRYQDVVHTTDFEVEFTLRPPLKANALGAVVGSILGAISKGLRDQGPDFFGQLGIGFIASTALATILSVVAVIYSSRRTGDAQPIVTVEDVWGGLLTGFLIGYAGHEYFTKLVPLK